MKQFHRAVFFLAVGGLHFSASAADSSNAVAADGKIIVAKDPPEFVLQPPILTPDEQYSHISLWCLPTAPLLIGCDLEKLDDFTVNLSSNDEVLEIDQDTLGKQATCVAADETRCVYAKVLDDGSQAVGLFNLGATNATVTADWQNLKTFRPQTVRDLWRQRDLGKFEKEFSANVAPHGVVLVRISAAK